MPLSLSQPEENQNCDLGKQERSFRHNKRKMGNHIEEGKLIQNNCCQRREKRREEWEA